METGVVLVSQVHKERDQNNNSILFGRIDKYHMIKRKSQLAKGLLSKVKLCTKLSDGQQAAIKRYNKLTLRK